MTNAIDGLLIEARDQSVQLEQIAANDLSANLDGYLAPSWTARRMVSGYNDYIRNGNTEEDAYLNMRKAFTESKGKSNKVFNDVIATHIKKTNYDMSKTMFPSDNLENEIKSALYKLNHFGFARLKFVVPKDITARLKKQILDKMVEDSGDEVEAALQGKEGAKPQIRSHPYWISTIEEMYQISADPALLEIVQRYMGVPPIFNTPIAFLNSHVEVTTEKGLSQLAQLYHHDMHRLGFVKLFIYLTDVDMDAGPHTLLSGTHRERPDPLWNDGRHTDEVVEKAGIMDQEEKIVGKAGTVFLVDTSALHKGCHPFSKPRLMAQVQYVNSLFGKRIASSDHKIETSKTSAHEHFHESAVHVRKYAAQAGVRFMQNFI